MFFIHILHWIAQKKCVKLGARLLGGWERKQFSVRKCYVANFIIKYKKILIIKYDLHTNIEIFTHVNFKL